MRFPPRFFSLIAALLSLLSTASAQPERATGKEEPERTFSLLIATRHRKGLHYRDARGEHHLLPPSRSRTPVRHSYEGPSPIVFYEKIHLPDGTVNERPLARAEFKHSMRKMLILLHPFDAAWSRCRAVVLDDSPRAFPYNSVQSLNLSIYPVQILLNGTRFTLQPTENKTLVVDPGRGSTNWHIAARIDEQWRLVRASCTQFIDGMRQMLLVNVDVTDPAKPRLDILSLYDQAPPEDSE